MVNANIESEAQLILDSRVEKTSIVSRIELEGVSPREPSGWAIRPLSSVRLNMQKWRNVYIKLIEAKDIKAGDVGGTSDPYAVVSVDGKKKAPLQSSILKKTLSPRWNQEFLVCVPDGDPDVDIFVYDWNRIASNEVIGKLKIDIVKATPDVVHYDWFPLEKKGSIKVAYKVSELKSGDGKTEPDTQNERLPGMRVHIENESYYPGEKVRGILVVNRHKLKKNCTLSLSFRSYSRVYQEGSTNISAEHEMHRIIVSKLAGDIPVGCNIWPFEFVLPSDLCVSKSTGKPAYAYNRTAFEAKMVAENGKAKLASADVQILSSRSFTIPRLPNLMAPLSPVCAKVDNLVSSELTDKEKIIWWKLTGPAQVFAGETYTFRAKIRHFGSAIIRGIGVKLEKQDWYCGKEARGERIGNWKRLVSNEPSVNLEWAPSTASELDGIIIKPGSEWEDDVTVEVPLDLEPSIHASNSPLLQTSYRIELRLLTTVKKAMTEIRGLDQVDGAALPVCVLNSKGFRPPAPEPHPRTTDIKKGMGPLFVWAPNDDHADPTTALAPNFRQLQPQFVSDLSTVFPSSSPASYANEFPKKRQIDSEEEWTGFGNLPLFLSDILYARHVPDDESFSDKHFIHAAAPQK